ncbi:MAG TPA: DUF998 domain-containing protein, partial [Chitinophagaceae bacterium]
GMNLFVPMFYPGYSFSSYTVSELSAFDAPTRNLWNMLSIPYTILVTAFGCGIWLVSEGKRSLRVVAALMIFSGLFGIFWQPMHQRDVLAAGGGTIDDTLHLVWGGVTVLLMFLMIGYGAASFDKKFRIFSIVSMAVFVVFGYLTYMEAPNVEKNLPTPWIGVWERINIAMYMVWTMVLASILLREHHQKHKHENKDIEKFSAKPPVPKTNLYRVTEDA